MALTFTILKNTPFDWIDHDMFVVGKQPRIGKTVLSQRPVYFANTTCRDVLSDLV